MRIAVVGSSGSGKSTLAGRLSAELPLPHIELAARPCWQAELGANGSRTAAARLPGRHSGGNP